MTNEYYQQCENQIKALFDNFNSENKKFNEIVKRGFLYSKIEKKEVLFVGLNPSFGKEAEEEEKDGKVSVKEEGFSAKENEHKYFNKFQSFFDTDSKYNGKWSFIDLLFVRETGQQIVKSFYEKETEFIKNQLVISKKMIEDAEPKIIVVCDTLSREFMKKDMNLDLKFDNKIGTYKVENDKSKLYGTIVFFSGMLSGQRALDLGSLQRLKWHIENVGKFNSQC